MFGFLLECRDVVKGGAVMRRRAVAPMLAAVLFASVGCTTVTAGGPADVFGCSNLTVQAVAGDRHVPVRQSETATLTTRTGVAVHLIATGNCSSNVSLYAPLLGQGQLRYAKAESYTPTEVGTKLLMVLWVPCNPPASGPAPACPLVEYGQVAVRSTA